MILICQSNEPGAHANALGLLAEGCGRCKRLHAGIMLLVDIDNDTVCMCGECGNEEGVRILDVQPKLLAALVEEQYADRTLLMLNLAQKWHEGCVPLSRRALFHEARWAQA